MGRGRASKITRRVERSSTVARNMRNTSNGDGVFTVAGQQVVLPRQTGTEIEERDQLQMCIQERLQMLKKMIVTGR